MTSRPFHRSRLFWLGALGLTFLVWAWWDSSATGTMVQWSGGGHNEREVWLENGAAGSRGVTHLDGYSPARDITAHRFAMLKSGDKLKGGFDFPPAFTSEADTSETISTKEVRVALWVIISAHVLVWLGAVIWWQQRKARLMARATSATGGAE